MCLFFTWVLLSEYLMDFGDLYMYMCVYIYIYNICIYTYRYICMYMHVHVCIHIYICIYTYLLTYSMVQSRYWEANWFAASQEIPRISRNPKVHYRTHKHPPPVPILGQPNPVHIPTSHLLGIHPNIIHPSKPIASPVVSFPPASPPIPYIYIYICVCVCVYTHTYTEGYATTNEC